MIARYLGPEPWVIVRVPWSQIELRSDFELLVHYETLVCREPAGVLVEEQDDAITLTVQERTSVLYEELVADGRSQLVRLRFPIADRQIVDGARQRLPG